MKLTTHAGLKQTLLLETPTCLINPGPYQQGWRLVNSGGEKGRMSNKKDKPVGQFSRLGLRENLVLKDSTLRRCVGVMALTQHNTGKENEMERHSKFFQL